MDRGIRFVILFIVGFFIFGLLWRLLFDEVTGKTKRQIEKGRLYRECSEITRRMEYFYKTNQNFPTNLAEVVRLPAVWRELRPVEELATNFVLHSAQAAQALAVGKTNVPLVFERLRFVGRERGGLVGFVFPPEVRWYEEARYQEYLNGTR